MQRTPVRRGGSRPFAKAIILGIVLIVALFIYNRINRHGVPQDLFSALEQEAVETRGWQQYGAAEKDSVKKAIAGFWIYESDTSSESPLRLVDRIELMDNGIIWRVMDMSLALLSGDTARATLAMHAYANPYAKLIEKQNAMMSEVRLIRSSRIYEGDTCFGPGNRDVVWTITGDGSMLALHGRTYSSYGDRDLAKFFPEGTIDIIDEPFKGSENLSPKEIWEKRRKSGAHEASGVFAMKECDEEVNLHSTIRMILTERMNAMRKEDSRNMETTKTLLSKYYIPYCLRAVYGYDNQPKRKAELEVEILPNGKVGEAEVKAFPGSRAQKMERSIVGEAKKWRFPAINGNDSLRVNAAIDF